MAATNKLLELIELKRTKDGAFRDCHHPEMIAWQATQAPSRSMYLEGRGESFLDDYIRIGKHLKECGCDTLCMCCNTAHYFIDELEKSIGIKFINILEEVAKSVKLLGGHKIGIMCSDGLKKAGIYKTYIQQINPNADVLFPIDDFQLLVTRGICNAKNTKRYQPITDAESPSFCFSKVSDWFKAQGCDVIVAGCTDIRNVYHMESTEECKYIDSLEVLADAILKHVYAK